jgi:hypothetical protein
MMCDLEDELHGANSSLRTTRGLFAGPPLRGRTLLFTWVLLSAVLWFTVIGAVVLLWRLVA